MTVLMTADAVGGVWTYALDLSRELAGRGTRVVLAVMGAPLSFDQRRAADRAAGLTLAVRPYKLEWMDQPWPDVADAGRWLLELERATRPDVVHLNGFSHGALPFAAPVMIAAHSCVLSWFRAVKRAAASSEWLPYEQAVKRGLDGARLIVAPSRAMALSVIHHYAPSTPVIAIHNGRDPTPYAPAVKEPFVLTAGQAWDAAKNVAQLAAIAPGVPWPIYVAGEGGDGIAGLRPLGRLSTAALAGWYGRASIYALPARYEPFGLSIVERLARMLNHGIALDANGVGGTVFSVTVPIAKAVTTHTPVVTSNTPVAKSSMSGALIVCIENDLAILDGMKTLLTAWDADVLVAADPETAVEAIASRGDKITGLLVDYHLDRGNGIAAIREIRRKYGRNIPAILITADRSPHVRTAASQEKIAVLNKPVKPASLRALLGQWRTQQMAAAE